MPQEEKGPATGIAEFERGATGQTRTSRMLFDYADALRRVGRNRDAHRAYDSIDLSTVPEKKRWLVDLYRGQLYHEEGRFALAESLFRSAITQNPHTTVPWVYLGASLVQQEKFEDAVAVLAGALELEGDQDEVYLNMAYGYRALGKLDDAKTCLQKALAITPDYSQAKEALADITAAVNVAHPS